MQTNKGWIFCLNSDYDAPDSGSSWGYVEDFLKDIRSGNKASSLEIQFHSDVYGKPCRKGLRLGPGDAVAFYHGKKARRSTSKLSPVKPYQISMIAFIDEVEQEEDGNVSFLACSIPRSLYDHLCANPLKKDDERVADVIASTGLGGGAVGSFFPIDYTNWKKLEKIAMP
tara:strand:+ start:1487 stop:1996 length:510 start_codon:yes stop_codon:yes gene_type:complete